MTRKELKAIRKHLGLSQANLASAIGVSRVLVGRMERGQASITPRSEKLARRLCEIEVDLGQQDQATV